ncbi:MAG: cobalt ECF transporter T component CbiQ [Candidatus Bathyarchaeota archaeon]|nr:cobalt ECF transporter T component CbiQ [Candidatus Bathyarchaeota archaeon]
MDEKMSHSDIYTQIDRCAYTNRFAKTSPTTKIFFALSALIISVSSTSLIAPIIIFASTTLLLLYFARVRVRLYLFLLAYPTFMVTLSCLFIALFFGTGQPIAEIALPWFNWTIFRSGVAMSIATFFRVEGAVSCLFFLVLTTSVTDLFITLRRAHVPKVLVEMSLLIYRYIFVLLEVTGKMNTAQKLRLGHSGVMRRIRSLGLLAGNLFIRTLEQGERTFTAMNARGYDGEIRVLEDMPPSSKTALAGIAVFDAALVVAVLFTMNIGVV